MIHVDAVVKSYRHGAARVQALAGVSLRVPAGEFLAVVGPSGSGKSTLLHLVAGLDRVDAGTISVAGQRLDAWSDDALTVFRRRRIGCVFQFFNLLPHLDARENVALPLLLDGIAARAARARAEALLERVGLAHRRTHRPDALSGGEMQRVAIARALVAGPAVILADEPTGNLDSRTAAQVLDLLRERAAEQRATVMMITHDADAAAWGDRVVTLRDGRLVAGGATHPLAAPGVA